MGYNGVNQGAVALEAAAFPYAAPGGIMNNIEAIIRPEKLTVVKDALADAGLPAINVTQVTGRGMQRGIELHGPRGVAGNYVVDMLPKVKLQTVVRDEDTQRAVDIIIANSRTGNIGDGKIFITPVANAIRIRTGEEGEGAL